MLKMMTKRFHHVTHSSGWKDWSSSLRRLWTTGLHFSHHNSHGRKNSEQTPTEWQGVSLDAVTMTLIWLTVVQVNCSFLNNSHFHASISEPADRKRRDTVSLEDLLRSTDRYNREDPKVGVKQITTGFKKWAMRYIGNCSGQRINEYQIDRMERWNNLLQAHLEREYVEE